MGLLCEGGEQVARAARGTQRPRSEGEEAEGSVRHGGVRRVAGLLHLGQSAEEAGDPSVTAA